MILEMFKFMNPTKITFSQEKQKWTIVLEIANRTQMTRKRQKKDFCPKCFQGK